MYIEYYSEFDDNDLPIIEKLEINIDENLPIVSLLDVIHERTKIPKYKEVKWEDNVEKIVCSYYYKKSAKAFDFKEIENFDQKINAFPKNGTNGELSLFIMTNTGLVN